MEVIQSIFSYDPVYPLIFTTSLFWYFFGLVLIGYTAFKDKIHVRNAFLLVFSLFFYYKSSGAYFLILILSTVVDYYLGNLIHKENKDALRKVYITLSMVVNLGLLAFYKYSYFIVDAINASFGTNFIAIDFFAVFSNGTFGTDLDIESIFLPVGISFYTFQTMSYSIDIYRRELEPAKNIFDFAFFVSFFPQLVAGPIVRAADFLPQIRLPYSLDKIAYNHAVFMIVKGLVKKILISDYISVNFVDRIFDAPASYTGFENLMAVYGYAIQIYCDFSGYTDIAIGVSLLLGFRLVPNFNSPYKSTDITEFWRRWHISLSTWLRDYLYISLGGNRKGGFRTKLNLLITMLLGGLWHGAHVKFIIWGGLHGIALIYHKTWLNLTNNRLNRYWLWKFVSFLITFHFVLFCWMFFRASDVYTVWLMIDRMVFDFQSSLVPEIYYGYQTVFNIIILGFAIHFVPATWKQGYEHVFSKIPDVFKAVLIAGIILALYQVKISDIQPFIYFQF